jgi:hypothetical protein
MTDPSPTTVAQDYPLAVNIEYPASRKRWSVLARLPLGLPVVFFSLLLNIGATLAIWGAIVASGGIPSWLFAFQVNVNRWHTRNTAYLLLLTDDYPVFEGEYPVNYELREPATLARWKLVVWKFITAIPHFVGLFVLTLGLVPVTVIAWLTLVIGGRHPPVLYHYTSGMVCWYARLAAYLQSLTDEFPAFSLRTTAAASSRRVYRVSAIIGLIPASAVAGFLVFIIGFTGTHVTNDVSYIELSNGETTSTATVESGAMRLEIAHDPADPQLGLFRPVPNTRYVAFTISIRNRRSAGETVPITASAFRLEDANGQLHAPVLVGVNGVPGPGSIGAGRTGDGLVMFEVSGVQPPRRLIWNVLDYIAVPRRGENIEWIFS